MMKFFLAFSSLFILSSSSVVDGLSRVRHPLPFSLRRKLEPIEEDPGKIVGGQEAEPGQFPYQVSFLHNGGHSCGGAIYDAETILTAAHCCSGLDRAFSIIAGQWSRKDEDGTEQMIDVARHVIHEDYGSFRVVNDICLLKLESPLQFNDFVAPVPMPNQGDEYNANDPAIVSGWGTLHSGDFLLPDKLQWVQVPIVSDEECRQDYGQNDITDSMLCAGEAGKDSCQGDSGGPMTCDGVHCGIVSWGQGCADEGYPGVYTQTSYYVDWIQSHA